MLKGFFKRTWRYGVSLTALSALVIYVGPDALIASVAQTDPLWLTAFVATYAVVPAIYGVQMAVALHLLGIDVSPRLAVAGSVNSWSVGMLTPARAGDLSLAYFLSSEAPARDTVALVVVDKILSLVILAVLACLAVLTIGFEYAQVVVTGAGVVLVAVLSVVLASRLPGAVQPVLKLGRRAMGGLPENIYDSFRRFVSHPRFLVFAIASSTGHWLIICLST